MLINKNRQGIYRILYLFVHKEFFVNFTARRKVKKTNLTPRNISKTINHLGGGPVVRAWDQEVCSLCGLKFKPCGCSYDGHWRFTWSLTSRPVGLVEVRASWPGYPR